MLKKCACLALILCAISPAFALDWGVFEDYEDEIEKYAMYKVLNDIPIKYAIEILNEKDHKDDNYNSNNKNEYEKMAKELSASLKDQNKILELESLIETAFNTWPRDTQQMIFEEDRKEEFADIYPLLSEMLSNRLHLKRVENKDKPDIVFIFSSKAELDCPKTAAACINLNQDPIQVRLVAPSDITELKGERKITLLSDTIHEIGHYFALVDQYEDEGDASAEYSTFNRIGKNDSIMASQNSYFLACDDVDGFINLIDLSLYLNKKDKSIDKNGPDDRYWSKRAQNGWASFCNGKKNGDGKLYQEEFYRKAKLLNKPNHTKGLYTQTFDAQGNLKNFTVFDPLDLYGKEFKPSVVGYGLAGKVIDKEHGREYDCTYNHIKDGVIDIYDLSTYDRFQYVRDELGGLMWSCSQINDGLMIMFYVGFQDDMCRIVNTFSTMTNSKDFTLTIDFDENDKFSSISYEMKNISLYDKNIKVKYPSYFYLHPEKEHFICFVSEGMGEYPLIEFSLKNADRIRIIEKDKEKLSTFTNKHRISEEEFINNAYVICKDMKEEANKENYKYKCNYFRKVEEFYKSRTSI